MRSTKGDYLNRRSFKTFGDLFRALRHSIELAAQLRIGLCLSLGGRGFFKFSTELENVVRHQQRRHHQHPRLAAWSRREANSLDSSGDLGTHGFEMVLLALLAANRVGIAVDAKSDLRHRVILS